jgi:hypothetical protein
MRRSRLWCALVVALGGWAIACGFGFANDTGKPIPSLDYWGWQCADGGAPDPDAGCPAPTDDAGP